MTVVNDTELKKGLLALTIGNKHNGYGIREHMRRHKLDIENPFVMPDLILHPLSVLCDLDAHFKPFGIPVFTGMTNELHLVNPMLTHRGDKVHFNLREVSSSEVELQKRYSATHAFWLHGLPNTVCDLYFYV